MRNLSLLAIALIALRLGSAAADDAAGDDLDDEFADLDLDDDDSSLDDASIAEKPPEVDDFDLGMPAEDQKKRMGACFSYTLGRVHGKQEMIQESVKDMESTHGMKRDQAMNALVFTWMMSCYMNIEPEAEKKAVALPAGQPIPLEDPEDEELFSQQTTKPQSVAQASKRQWALLEGVLKENEKNVQKQKQKSQSGAGRPGQAPQAPAAEPTSMLYLLVAFGAIFGTVGLVVAYLAKKDKDRENDKVQRGNKSLQKKEKAEQKLAKKRM